MDLTFVAELPPKGTGSGRPPAPYLQALRDNPDQWAEIARYPCDRRMAAVNRGNQIGRRHSDIEYATRTVGDETVLYLRAVKS